MTFRKRCYIKPKRWLVLPSSQISMRLGCVYTRFLNAIFVFQKVELYKGLLNFLETEMTFRKCYYIESKSMKTREKVIRIGQQRFLNAIFVFHKMLSYTKDYLTFWKPKMTFRKCYYIKPKSMKIHEKGQSDHHVGFIQQRFLNAIFVFKMLSYTKDHLTFWKPKMTFRKPWES